jgi:hypothetical protein
MNLETLATFRGEAWAKRVLRETVTLSRKVECRWPGEMMEARKLAALLGPPRLVSVLAAIIQERATVAWDLAVQP